MSYSDSFRTARWLRFINLLLQALLFLALFAGLNYVALNHAWRFDVTASHRHSLSPETKAYLEQLERDVTIIVTLTDNGDSEELAQAYRDITALLREYTYYTRGHSQARLTVRYVDVYQNRREAEALGVEQPNVVVLQSDRGRSVKTLDDLYVIRKKVSREAFRGEAAITAALLDVSKAEKKKIFFLAGHGEMSPDSVDGARGLSQLRDQLRQRNYDLENLDLNLARRIPDDAALLIIPAPERRFQPFEEELLRQYLTTRAGRVLLMVSPGNQFGLENLLFDWGIRVFDNVIYDTDPQSLTDNGELLLRHFLPHPITQVLIDNGLYLLAGPTRVVNEDIGRAPDDGLSVKKLIATSPTAWGESDYRLRSRPEYTPGQDLRGQLGVLVVSERLKPANLPLSVPGGRLAVFGTADLVTNNRIINGGNFPVVLNTVSWAIGRDTQLNIPARPIERFQLSLSQEELVRLRLGLFFIVPGLAALLGLLVYWTRRN
ncbi:MAG: GldG family protein [Opitutaceae bacterium]|nr:GldG family protein [Opitutaceae bacterium]